jgi:hypothetical protein
MPPWQIRSRRQLEDALTRLVALPREDSDFSYTAADAIRDFGCEEATLDALRDFGLARRGTHEDTLYAFCDLHYLGIRQGVAKRFLFGMRQWRRALHRVTAGEITSLRIAYVPQLEDNQEGTPARIRLPGTGTLDVMLRSDEVCGEFEAPMSASWPSLPEPAVGVLRDIPLDFCLLPNSARGCVERVHSWGVIDCWTAALVLRQGFEDVGLRARIVEGFIVGIPYASPHVWAEVLLSDVWTPVDPLMVTVLHQFAGLDPKEWPLHRSLGSVLVPVMITDVVKPLIEVAGEWAPATIQASVA